VLKKTQNNKIGAIGEKEAIRFLKNKDFNILHHHYTSRWGEIDIVAKKGKILYFIEVKTRTSDIYGKPYEAINYWKLKSLLRCIKYYILEKKIKNVKLAFAIITILLNADLTVEKISFYADAHLLYNNLVLP
jgi:putative endonuclease